MMRDLWFLFRAEGLRAWRLWLSYKVPSLVSLLLHAVIFPVFMVLFQHLAARQNVGFGQTQQMDSLIGFLTWYLCMKVLADIPRMVEEEAAVGTLEQVWNGAYGLPVVLLMRVFVLSIRYFLETALLAIVLMILLPVRLQINGTAFAILLLTILGTWGAGMGLAGLALRYKSIGSVTDVIANLGLIVSGALVPINSLGWLFAFLKVLLPTTWGIDLLREALTNSLVPLPMSDWAGLLLQTAILLILGIWSFNHNIHRARVCASLQGY